MPHSDSDIVLGLLLHVGGIHVANSDSKKRIIDSIAPVNKDWGIWQARDNYIGASWIIALGANAIWQLTSYRNDGSCWREYKPSASMDIYDVNDGDDINTKAVVASFHDTKHDLAPPTLLRVRGNYIYRNVSGHVVPLPQELAVEILELNDIKS